MVLQKNVDKQKSTFYLQEGINSKSIKPLIELITSLPDKSSMDLYINSVGGVIPVAIGVFNFIKSIKCLKLKTYNIGHCDSAAMLLYMLGKKRFATANSSFYLHSLNIRVKPIQTILSLKAELETVKNDTKVVLDLLSNSSKISKKTWETWMSDKGTRIKAEKAVSFGICDKIICVKLF